MTISLLAFPKLACLRADDQNIARLIEFSLLSARRFHFHHLGKVERVVHERAVSQNIAAVCHSESRIIITKPVDYVAVGACSLDADAVRTGAKETIDYASAPDAIVAAAALNTVADV